MAYLCYLLPRAWAGGDLAVDAPGDEFVAAANTGMERTGGVRRHWDVGVSLTVASITCAFEARVRRNRSMGLVSLVDGVLKYSECVLTSTVDISCQCQRSGRSETKFCVSLVRQVMLCVPH